uniref:Uncharacterized protein n=1 Tax=Anguilla anguilla TaxID=7936 RepID=A0A0E9UA48_ANGAN
MQHLQQAAQFTAAALQPPQESGGSKKPAHPLCSCPKVTELA